MALNLKSLERELAALNVRYRGELDTLQHKLADTIDRYDANKVSDHDAFNMAATTQNLAVLAGKIEQTANVIRWTREAK